MSWLLGFAISGFLWLILNTIWPPKGLREVDEKDVFGTFNPTQQVLDSESHKSSVCEDVPEED
jgi:nucleobase:cation symporter-1, NCS1 family